MVLRDSLAEPVHIAEIELRVADTLVGGQLVPTGGLGVVPGDRQPVGVQDAEIELGGGIAVFRKRSPQAQPGRIVARLEGIDPVLIGARLGTVRTREHPRGSGANRLQAIRTTPIPIPPIPTIRREPRLPSAAPAPATFINPHATSGREMTVRVRHDAQYPSKGRNSLRKRYNKAVQPIMGTTPCRHSTSSRAPTSPRSTTPSKVLRARSVRAMTSRAAFARSSGSTRPW